MTDISVEVKGAERLQAWLSTAPIELLRAIQETTGEGGAMLLGATRAYTDIDTGALLASEQLSVRDTPFGASARVSSDLRYTRYVERGTREHGRAQYMFRRAAVTEAPPVEAIFDYKIRRIVE